jgi:hypothetical protein
MARCSKPSPTLELRDLYQEIADLASNYVGGECQLWSNGTLRDLRTFQLVVQDHFGSEADAHGYRETTTRNIKIHADRVLLRISKVIHGFDEYDSGGYSDSSVEILAESSWWVSQAIGERDLSPPSGLAWQIP